MRKKVENIIIVCDCCGEHFVNGDGFTCYTDDPNGDNILDEATSSGWMEIGDRHYCDKCHHIDDEDHIVTDDGHKYDYDTHKEIFDYVLEADVKDGDILCGGECIFIYKGIDREQKHGGTANAIEYYACMNKLDDYTSIGPKVGVGCFGGLDYRRAFKEEIDLLFERLKRDGYEWDAEKKELKRFIKHGGK